ncbi:MAG: glycosyltransferase [Candidatus Limnocylindrus sp.]
MIDAALQLAAGLSGALRRARLRLSLITVAAVLLGRGALTRAMMHLRIALTRGPAFSSMLVDEVLHQPDPLLVRLVERLTRTNLLPNSEVARVRAAALTKRSGGAHDIDMKVARVLAPKGVAVSPAPRFPEPDSIARRRYITMGPTNNPYVWMMNSQLSAVGLSLHYVSGFSGVLHALRQAQERGERPHVHLDTWLSPSEAAQLTAALHPSSTLSITAHDLEQNESRRNRETGARHLLTRANAIHLLTPSALQRLGFQDLEGDPRVFHVPHPSYYGRLGGSYGLPLDRSEARKRLGRSTTEYSVGLVGRISDRKHVELLIDAAEILNKELSLDQLPRIYISGSLRTRFAERMVRQCAALSNLELFTDDLDDQTAGLHIAALDVAVVPYHRYLNSGWTLLALSAGLPIIASRESTAREVVPADALTTFAEGDAHSLAEVILRLAECDRTVAERAARQGAELIHPDRIAPLYAHEMAARVFCE